MIVCQATQHICARALPMSSGMFPPKCPREMPTPKCPPEEGSVFERGTCIDSLAAWCECANCVYHNLP